MSVNSLRVDQNRRFDSVTLTTGEVLEGEWWMDLAAGNLQASQFIFITDGKTVIPIGAVLSLALSANQTH